MDNHIQEIISFIKEGNSPVEELIDNFQLDNFIGMIDNSIDFKKFLLC